MKTASKTLALGLATAVLFATTQVHAQACKLEQRDSRRAQMALQDATDYEAAMLENLVAATRDVKYSNVLQATGLIVYIPAAYVMAFSAPFLLLALPGLISGSAAVSLVTIPITDLIQQDEEYFVNRKLVRFAVSESYVRELMISLPGREPSSLQALNELFQADAIKIQDEISRTIAKIPGRLRLAIQDVMSGGEAEAEIHGYLYALAKAKRSNLYIQSEIQKARASLCERTLESVKKSAP